VAVGAVPDRTVKVQHAAMAARGPASMCASCRPSDVESVDAVLATLCARKEAQAGDRPLDYRPSLFDLSLLQNVADSLCVKPEDVETRYHLMVKQRQAQRQAAGHPAGPALSPPRRDRVQ
jgi:hypothetical protein